ncbi:SRPBCC family protein [Aeromicrobium sp. CFBP 8757]|uniref:SRPBCC family protein n=1 Tax=Aeromicrobium sp. CFBP 8757 TaxID=2775288 RepID=UPI00177C3021|nr:SRPBCC family protein [Aeromicrobium sp. CFBP 8757]MBD8606909.1 SRPBCC family protein [Aeromicrobium sp. CFBP 8757]
MDSDIMTVERTISAPPEQIFALLSDAGRHQSFDGSGTVRGTRAESRPLTLGTTFGMAMHMGVGYRTSNTVVEFEQDRRIAWKTTGLKGLVGGRIWRYELVPVEGGTLVKESWDVSQDKQKFFLKRSKMPAATKNGMRKTLERIAGAVER